MITTKLSKISHPGHTLHGEEVTLQMHFDDHPTLQVMIEAGTLPTIASVLREAGNAAMMARETRPGGESLDERATPWTARGFRTGKADGHLMLQVQTAQGIPLVIAIPTHLVPDLTSKLAAEQSRSTGFRGPTKQ